MQNETPKNKIWLAAGIICTEAFSLILWIMLILACCAADPKTAIKILVMRSLLYVLRAKEIRRWEK